MESPAMKTLRTMQTAIGDIIRLDPMDPPVLRKHYHPSGLPQERCLTDQRDRCRDTQPELYVETQDEYFRAI